LDTKKDWRYLATKDFPEIIYIQWRDAVSEAGWENVEKAETHLVLSIGFLISETVEDICIAAAISNDQSNSRMQIPKGMIKRIKRVKLNKFLNIRRRKPLKLKAQKQKVENSSNGSETNLSKSFVFPVMM